MGHNRARELLEEAQNLIVKCREDIENGGTPDMGIFEKSLRDFCDVLAHMPREEAKEYEKNLQDLGQSLHSLSEDLSRKRDELRMRMQGLGAQQRAAEAYARSSRKNSE